MIKKETVWPVEGMHCVQCEKAILRVLCGLSGLERVRVDYRHGTITALWDASQTSLEQIQEKLAEQGYTIRTEKRRMKAWMRVPAFLAFLIFLYILMTATPLSTWANAFPLARAGMSLGALFLIGVMTSVHCVAMCGGINLSQSASAAQKGHNVIRTNMLYQLGRILSYTLVGMLIGALGGVLSLTDGMKAAVQLTAAFFMLVMALNLLGGFSWMKRFSVHLPQGLFIRIARWSGGRSSFMIGMANGLMPCGPLQSMQLYALSTGNWLMGGLAMLSFALGTTPLMLGFGVLGGRLNQRFQRPMHVMSAMLLLTMGMSMFSSGMALVGFRTFMTMTSGGNENIAVLTADGQYIRSELDYGSYPDIVVQAGTPVTWVIHAEAEKINGCNNSIIIPAINLRIDLQAGDNEISFTPQEVGTIAYSCWMGMIRSSIQVVESLETYS